jgi:hypothetical protein
MANSSVQTWVRQATSQLFGFYKQPPLFERLTGQLSCLPLDPWNQHQTIARLDQIITDARGDHPEGLYFVGGAVAILHRWSVDFRWLQEHSRVWDEKIAFTDGPS